MFLFGKSVFNALLATIAAGIVPALVAYSVGLRFSKSLRVAVMAGVLTFFSPYQVWMSTRTEAIIFFGAFGSLAILFATKGRANPRMFLVAALCTGLTHLVRQDGILMLFAVLACIALAPVSRRTRLVFGVGALFVHVLVISPMLVRNFMMFHSPMPPGPANTMFLTSYEDFHSYGKELDWNTLRATWGIRGLITKRLHTAAENLGQIQYFLDPVLLFLVSLGAVHLLHRKRPRDLFVFVPVLIFAGLEYFFYTVIASFSGPGTLPKALAIVLPFVCIVIVDFFDYYIQPGLVFAAAVIALSAYSAYQGYQSNYISAVYYSDMYDKYRAVESLIVDDAAEAGVSKDGIVMMARDVWDFYEATGIKTVMIPNNDLQTILFIAQHYHVRYMLLPAPRPALDDIFMGTTPDAHFAYVGTVAGTHWRVFRLQFGAQ
jgi:4-amino-4-deoxy-L-arabinose transferase-like glycosyltransferase